MIPFGDRLAAAMDERGPLCVGIDPHPKLLQGVGFGRFCRVSAYLHHGCL